MWTCPSCQRRFGRTNQGHECLAVIDLDEWLAAEEPWVRAVCEPVLDHLDALGDDHVVEPAEVGLLVKRRSTIVELRPRRKWVDLSFKLPGKVDHDRITRSESNRQGTWTYNVVRLQVPGDLDDLVLGWVTESYLGAEPAR